MKVREGTTLRDWLKRSLSLRTPRLRRVGAPVQRTRHDDPIASIWGIDACDRCGRTILLGERTSPFRRDNVQLTVCPTCESDLIAEGFRRAA